MTISAIHRVSLATHDLAEAQKFFESYIGLGRAIKVADQTIAFGSGSRGLRIKSRRDCSTELRRNCTDRQALVMSLSTLTT